MAIFKKKSRPDESIDMKRLPHHIAIIMDGNGRWAEQRHLPRTAGHQQGVEAIREIVKTASEMNIEMMTLYAFSTENWKRPENEVQFLMNLLVDYLRKEIEELNRQKVCISTIGDLSRFHGTVRDEIEMAIAKTASNNGLKMNIALNYGGRNELTRVIKQLMKEAVEGQVQTESISEDDIRSRLDTAAMPDPDLLIRTSGEQRISNFLLWQLAYTELYFTDTLWPDFRGEHFKEAIKDYQNRKRRFGGLT
ncbi:isoprenyl transferase [Anoxynatronum buryatiense]|uniref:Isoprenyl transferase n=1 Tax=Anoxynatronum buryatiense TaxID=489973 RepID=A0AA45WUE3_9CLOT|nr:isoprenyl transferase [Anoxynatronum buryatiense]SMP47483.1 Undecaprenyl pyrophosphate synthetase [Anoxynatronum buryatiense]